MDNQKLLGFQRAEFEKAKQYSLYSVCIQLAIILLFGISIFVNIKWVTYGVAFVSIILTLIWQFCSIKARNSHLVSERARRIFLLTEGLGHKVSGKLFTDMFMAFSVTEQEGEKYQDPKYFKSSSPPGYLKLAQMLEESAFWTKHLCKIAATKYWRTFAILFTLSIGSLVSFPFIPDFKTTTFVAQFISVILIWLITGEVLRSAYAYSIASRKVDDIENRLSLILESATLEQDLLFVLGDYNSVTQAIPTISTSIYKKNKEKLNRLWIERISKK